MYSVELARGGSHIASTRGLASFQAAMTEILEDFKIRHGMADITVFLDLLATRLEARELAKEAGLVQRIATVGIDAAFDEAANTKESNGKRR
ncbi:hypothetical protein [Paraburkholderia sp. DHOC27]|uniref:hypothetical protein n=1 Tax=Paraburkholderia sp. DHOC27 TaxID=2303330 RepID=UPI000E3C0D79|nr:hypothetical protein [Paraburkholderia sp. DHOC27]RFU44484.1 hypothetical protein D0B32_28185 [Paraburkholderia sp. DHOC27]